MDVFVTRSPKMGPYLVTRKICVLAVSATVPHYCLLPINKHKAPPMATENLEAAGDPVVGAHRDTHTRAWP